MAAYNATAGFVEAQKEDPTCLKIRFKTPPSDSIVVVARCTRIMLEYLIMERAKEIAGDDNELTEHLETPKFTWVNGVPGCGKTAWIIRNFDKTRDVVITGTKEAANDLREKLGQKGVENTRFRVRTMASALANGFGGPPREGLSRLIISEALMSHFGAIVMVTKIAGARETLMFKDVNQVPYIDRKNAFNILYRRPDLVTGIHKELLCTHRNPMDVAYALSEVYEGIYASNSRIRSLEQRNFSGAQIPKSTDNTLYLTHTQSEKALLKAEGFGSGNGSRVSTIHEAQGATFDTVIIVRTTQTKRRIHCEVPHAVVSVSRHTNRCTYYSDDHTDAIAMFISRAMRAEPGQIQDYNLKMAIRNGDEAVVNKIVKSDKFVKK